MKTRFERAGLVALCALIGWFYVWTVRSGGETWDFGAEQDDYYNLLIDGWLDGQLNMKVAVPEALLQLQDPYDPAVRPPGLGLHDASFYRGKYYLYFGAAPVAVLMLPFRLLTGVDLPQPVAALVFVYGGFLASLAILMGVRRHYFPETRTWVVLLGGLVLGLAGLGPVLLRRPHMWELPIGAGYGFAMLALLSVWQSLHAGPRRARWFAGAGLALGLAIASRPTYLIASPFLVVPVLWWWWSERRLPWRAALSGVVPLAVVGSAMAWHNYARFDHPLQFGQAYQFSLDYESKMAHFRLGHVPFNLWRYFFSAAEWTRFFPFIHPAELPPKPPGFGGHDDVYGVLRNLPIAWLALAAPLALWRRDKSERGPLAAWLATAAALFAGMAGTLMMFFGSLARYQSDFTPTLMLLAGVGVMAVERWAQSMALPRSRTALRLGWAAAAVFSSGFAVLFSLQLNAFLLERNPPGYHEVARRLNQLPAWWESLTGVRYGPLELSVRLAAAPAGTRQVIVSIGSASDVDRLLARYVGDGRVQFEIQSGHGVSHVTPPVNVDFASTHQLRLTLGSLLPPAAHPLIGRASLPAIEATARRLVFEFDGRILVDRTPWFAVVSGKVRLGTEAAGVAGAVPFSGSVATVRRDEEAIAALLQAGGERTRGTAGSLAGTGAIRLRLILPRDRAGVREPLVVAGRPGRGDLLSIEYGEAGTIRFVLDHWGGEMRRSEPVTVDFAQAQEITVMMDSLQEKFLRRSRDFVVNGQIEIELNGRRVWAVPAEFYAASPVEVAVAENPLGGTSCTTEFTGQVITVETVGRPP